MGVEGRELADRIVMTSGLSSALSCSDIKARSSEMLHSASNTADGRTTENLSANEVAPEKQALQEYLSL